MLTEREAQLVADALLVRVDERDGRERWFAIEDDALPEAHRLHELGYLDRTWHHGDLVYRASEQAAKAQELYAATSSTITPN